PARPTRPPAAPLEAPTPAGRSGSHSPPPSHGTLATRACSARSPHPETPRSQPAAHRKSAYLASLPTFNFPLLTFNFHQVQQLPLRLRRPPADRRQLQRPPRRERLPARLVEEVARLADADDPPAQVTEQLPPVDCLPVDRAAPGLLVGLEQLLPLADAAHGPVVVAETPGAHADPRQVLHRIADVRQL